MYRRCNFCSHNEIVTVVCEHWYYCTQRYEYFIEYSSEEEFYEILHQIREDLKEWEKVTFIFSYVIDGKGYEVKHCID